MQERFAAKRVFHIVLIFCVATGYSVAAGFLGKSYLDTKICLVLIDLLFFSLFLMMLISERKEKHIAANLETDYRKIFFGFLVSAILMLCFFKVPAYIRPVILIPMIMTALSNSEIAFCTAVYLNTIFAVAFQCSAYEILCYSLLTVFGCILAKTMEHMLPGERRKNKVWYSLLILSLQTAVPVFFYYFNYQESSYVIIEEGLLSGCICILFVLFVYPWLVTSRIKEVDRLLEGIIDENYSLVKDLKNFSMAEYEHALRVSKMAGKCAALVGADEGVCKAAGFYYRIGVLDGDPMVENGVYTAQLYYFPAEVTAIISEYYGEKKMPSTIDSAIVQMADGVVKKLEALNGTNTMQSGWNKEMVIYQTLNEYSTEGLYDQSGLSMNMFLKIREYMVKEEALLL